MSPFSASLQYALRARRHVHNLERCEAGATAIEFSMVAIPFFMFIFGLFVCALYFYVLNSVDKGMDEASRLIRTGQAVSSKMTVKDFKNTVCSGAGIAVQCAALQVFVKTYSDWASLQAQPCLDSQGKVITNPASDSDQISAYSGTASDIVLVTACYKWGATASLPYLRLGNMTDGSMMLQSTTAFRSEPYPTS